MTRMEECERERESRKGINNDGFLPSTIPPDECNRNDVIVIGFSCVIIAFYYSVRCRHHCF